MRRPCGGMGTSSHKAALRRLGQQVRSFRLEAGISQEELAYLANLDRTYISQIERGVCNPSVLVLLNICRALKQPASALFAAADQ